MSLVLVPTPLQDDLPLESVALELLKVNALKENVVLLVEEHKVARQRWLKWGLPREAIEKFILFNEHTQKETMSDVLKKLKAGSDVYLLSDCGLPAFCDPGQVLVDACHKQRIKVTSTPFPNSIALSVSLSGFSHDTFVFSGFVPVKEPERTQWMKKEFKRPETLVWMETPYRLKKLLEEVAVLETKRDIFLALDLGSPSEELLRGKAPELARQIPDKEKREFVLLIGPIL
ncbi:MAG: SAM-dependent methyltransferase [Bacteriovoracaceae bacterium]